MIETNLHNIICVVNIQFYAKMDNFELFFEFYLRVSDLMGKNRSKSNILIRMLHIVMLSTKIREHCHVYTVSIERRTEW